MALVVKFSGPLFDTRERSIHIAEELDKLADEMEQWIRDNAPEHWKAYKEGIRHVTVQQPGGGSNLLIDNAWPESIYADEGRSPGKQPPPAAMLALVQRAGLGGVTYSVKTRKQSLLGVKRTKNRAGIRRTRAQSLLQIQRQIAFLIGRHIGRFGTTGKHLYERVLIAKAEAISRTADAIGAKLTAQINR